MSELESALRNALAKGDDSDPAFRQRVYRAAADALERALTAKQTDEERKAEQKSRLAEAIRSTEASYNARAETSPSVDLGEPRHRDPTPALGPETTMPELRAEPRAETVRSEAGPSEDSALPGEGPMAERRERAERKSAPRRSPLGFGLAIIVALGLVIVGGWWIVSTGAFQSASERDTSVPNPPLELESESFQAARDPGTSTAPRTVGEGPADSEGWITLFDPTDPTTLSLQGDATATVEDDGFGQYALIASSDTQSGVNIDVPPGTFGALAGRTAQFSILARSAGEEPTEISVACDFGDLGDCGRRRFTATQSENEFLFRVDLPAAGSTATGEIFISTGIESAGKAAKLSAVRVRRLTE